jgi:hypothetical protein
MGCCLQRDRYCRCRHAWRICDVFEAWRGCIRRATRPLLNGVTLGASEFRQREPSLCLINLLRLPLATRQHPRHKDHPPNHRSALLHHCLARTLRVPRQRMNMRMHTFGRNRKAAIHVRFSDRAGSARSLSPLSRPAKLITVRFGSEPPSRVPAGSPKRARSSLRHAR